MLTLDEIERFAQTPRDRIGAAIFRFRFGTAKDKHVFQNIVRDAFDLCASDMSQARDQIKNFNENQLTDRLVSNLSMLGLTAVREKSVNGHCDVTVSEYGIIYLGEAKIFTSYSKLLGGFQQLCDRYATGLPDHDAGSFIIYFKTRGVKTTMEKWSKKLSDEYQKIACNFCAANPLVLHSEHPHHITELPYYVRHLPIAVMHDPSDAKPRKKPKTAGKVANPSHAGRNSKR